VDVPAVAEEAADMLETPSIKPPTLGEPAQAEPPEISERALVDGAQEPNRTASAPHVAAETASASSVEQLGQQMQTLIADIRTSQEQARAEAAARSAQIEALMADLHALQAQLKERGLLDSDWQPPSWAMYLPHKQPDMQTKEADG
ncbi:MAG TPA: hypothetical protein VFX76_06045, partial [Roseiflexaceae bacterium]|nr:hypothetical protein [Roseiflexaceae bacterium]